MLEFNAERHEYKLDGVKIPSVSEILSPLVDLSGVPGALLLHASQFGSVVHRTLELYDKNDLDMDSVDAPIMPYLSAWQNFLKESKCEIIANEQILASEALRYAGTIDRVMNLWGSVSIVDIKTGIVSKTEQFQVAAYEYLWNCNHPESKVTKRYSLHFKGDKAELIPYTDKDDIRTFLALLQVRNACLKHNIDKFYWEKKEESNNE
jgi:hypothetical protein